MTKRAVGVLWILSVCAPGMMAQSIFGVIRGAVTDRSGGVVQGAQITIINQADNIGRQVVADAQGAYEANNLKAGEYNVTAEAPGFKTFRQQNLALDARQTLRVDVVLEVGELSEQITVEGTVAVVNTETQTIAASFSSKQVLSLPANYRGAGSTSPLRLLSYLPGVQVDNSFRFSVQGALPHQTEVSLDGISTVSVRSNGPLDEVFPSVEGIAEMKVQGVGNNAEFGQVGDITTTSKAGSNYFHGSLFEYMQNRVFDATSYGSVTKPQKTANTFGGSLGGPVIKNRTFFFGTFEGMRYRRGATIQNTVPTAAMRQGDFSKEPGVLADPFSGNPYPNNQIPSSQIIGIGPKILGFYPLPNFGRTDVETSSNFRENRASPITSNQFDLRADHLLTAKQSVFARFSFKNQNAVAPNDLLLPADDQYNDSRSLTVSHSYTITPSLLNEFRIGFTNNDSASSYAFDGQQIAQDLGLQGLPALSFNGLPAFNFSSGTTSFGKGKAGFTYSRNFQFNNNLTWIKGRHTLKFGGDFRRLRAASDLGFIGSDNYGNFYFDGEYTGADVADFLVGLPFHSAYADVKQDTDGLSWHYGFYGQDSFKVTPKLTLEYGLRWEYHPPFKDAAFNITNFDRSVPGTGRVVIPSDPIARDIAAPGFLLSINACPAPDFNGIPCTPFLTAKEAGWPETLRFPWKKNFNPRFGFAYRPFDNNKTVLRGGFGMYTMTILGSVFYSLTGIHGSDVREFDNKITNGAPLFRLPQIAAPGSGITAGSYGSAYFGTANDPHFRDPYAMQWNLTVEREVAADTGFRVSYIGLRSVELPYSPDLNQPRPSTTPFSQRPLTDRPFPYWNRIYSRDTGANGIYNALQTEVNHRGRGGLTLNTAWTWAKNLSDATGPTPSGFSAENGGDRLSNSLDRRAERGDVPPTRRHRWISTAVYELPFGKGKRFMSDSNAVLDAIAGGWRVSTILLLQTGPFLTPSMTGGDPSGTGAPSRGGQRPDAVRDGNLDNPTADVWFDRSAFVCPGRVAGAADQFNCNVAPIGRFGNAGVGTLVGPGTINLSMGFAKDFQVSEMARLRLEASFTNLPNHPNLSDPTTNITSIGFGRITSARGSDSGGNRVGQFALRLEF